ncbi:butyrophilin-like protein 3 [Pholidichthys leucotaenia]
MFVLLMILSFLPAVTAALEDVPVVKARPGEDVTLQCRAFGASTIKVLEWIRPDLESHGHVFLYRNNRTYERYQHPSFRGRVELVDPSMKDGEVSVVLKNISVNDTGTYDCQVIFSHSRDGKRVQSDFRRLTNLTVTGQREDTAERGRTDEGGGSRIIVYSVVGVLLLLLSVAVVAVVILKKTKQGKSGTHHTHKESPLDAIVHTTQNSG